MKKHKAKIEEEEKKEADAAANTESNREARIDIKEVIGGGDLDLDDI